jgi:hypothetical protein
VYQTAAKAKVSKRKKISFEIKDLLGIFCRFHNSEQIPYDNDIKVGFVIDTDTDRIYSFLIN